MCITKLIFMMSHKSWLWTNLKLFMFVYWRVVVPCVKLASSQGLTIGGCQAPNCKGKPKYLPN